MSFLFSWAFFLAQVTGYGPTQCVQLIVQNGKEETTGKQDKEKKKRKKEKAKTTLKQQDVLNLSQQSSESLPELINSTSEPEATRDKSSKKADHFYLEPTPTSCATSTATASNVSGKVEPSYLIPTPTPQPTTTATAASTQSSSKVDRFYVMPTTAAATTSLSVVTQSNSDEGAKMVDDVQPSPDLIPSEEKEFQRLSSETRRLLLCHQEHAMTLSELWQCFRDMEDPACPQLPQDLMASLQKQGSSKAQKSSLFQVRVVTYICMYTYTHICTYICIHTYIYVCTYMYIRTCTYICIHTCTYICIHTCTCMYIRIYVHVHTYAYIHVCTYIYTCTYVHVRIYIHVHTYKVRTCICMCTCM